MKIPITKPVLDEVDLEYVSKPIKSGWLVQGPYVREFEEKFAQYTGAKYAIATTSCTTALHLSLISLGVNENDKVILPAFTFVATANVVEYLKAKPIFVDINLRTFNIDEEKIEEVILKEKNIKLLLPVNLFGLCANLPKIIEIAIKYNIEVLEDSACAFGSYISNKHAGTFGILGCFSFHPRKVITTGEGGIIITNNQKLAEDLRILRDHGASKNDFFRHNSKYSFLLPEYNVLGYNYRMTDIQGALGVSQLLKADKILSKRKEIAKKYYEFLGDIDSFVLPYIPANYEHSFQSFVLLYVKNKEIFNKLSKMSIEEIDKLSEERNKIMFYLEEMGISTRQGTHAVHILGYYKNKYNLNPGDFINSYIADKLSISLPIYDMNDQELEYVIDSIKKVLSKVVR